jgi:anthranilate/para-aminobenzoate synthase component II
VQTVVASLKHEMKVIRNDAATLDEIESWKPTHVIISPGPCTPNESG